MKLISYVQVKLSAEYTNLFSMHLRTIECETLKMELAKESSRPVFFYNFIAGLYFTRSLS